MILKMTIKQENGVAAVEMAIILPVLLLLALGICQFGILFYNEQVLTNASREAARAGIIQRTDDSGVPLYTDAQIESMLDDIVQNYVSGRLITFGGGGTPVVVSNGVNGDFGEDLSVTVTYDYRFFGGASFFGLDPQIPLKGETWMRMEQIQPGGS